MAKEALMFDRIRSWFETRRSGKTPLQRNMEKALHMKQEAGPQTNIPDTRPRTRAEFKVRR